MKKPIFFVDGPDRSGKTSLIEYLSERFHIETYKDSSYNFKNLFSSDNGETIHGDYANYILFSLLVKVSSGLVIDRGILSEVVYGQVFRNKGKDYEKKLMAMEGFWSEKQEHFYNVIILPNIDSAIQRCLNEKEEVAHSTMTHDEVAKEFVSIYDGYDRLSKISSNKTFVIKYDTDNEVTLYFREGNSSKLETVDKLSREEGQSFDNFLYQIVERIYSYIN